MIEEDECKGDDNETDDPIGPAPTSGSGDLFDPEVPTRPSRAADRTVRMILGAWLGIPRLK